MESIQPIGQIKYKIDTRPLVIEPDNISTSNFFKLIAPPDLIPAQVVLYKLKFTNFAIKHNL